MKKLFIISSTLFLLVLIFLGVYNFAFKNNSVDPIADPKKKAAIEKQKAEEAEAITRSVAFEQMIPEDVFQPAAGENSFFYYSERDNALKEIGFDGKNQSIRVQNLPGKPLRVVWSPKFTSALLLIQKDDGDLWYFADLRNQNVLPLKKEMSRLAWTSLGDRILYQNTDPLTGARSLESAMTDGFNPVKLADLGTQDSFITAIPQSSLVAFWERGDSGLASTLETVNINGESRRIVTSGRFGTDFLWSPNNRRLLIQSVKEKDTDALEIGLLDENGTTYKNLFAPTLVSKIVWSKDSETFYYALPGTFPPGSRLPNDYFGKPLYSKDTFWKMNIRTGKKERLVPLEEIDQAFDATYLFLSPSETDLYFVDRLTKKLFRITL